MQTFFYGAREGSVGLFISASKSGHRSTGLSVCYIWYLL